MPGYPVAAQRPARLSARVDVWDTPEFEAELRGWVTAQVGPVTSLVPSKRRPWAVVWRAEKAEGAYYAKQNSPGQAFEAQLVSFLRELAPHLSPQSIVSTNTSGIPIRDIAKDFPAAARFLGTHFFNPPRYLKLVEIVAGPDTSEETLAQAEDLCGRVLGKGLVRGVRRQVAEG